MQFVTNQMQAFHHDTEGAAFIEYTALLGVILAVAIGVLTIVGNWASTRWNTLASGLNAVP